MPMFQIEPVATVRAGVTAPVDDVWGGTTSRIELVDTIPDDAIAGLSEFSHVEVVFVFDRVETVTTGARHPRGNTAWPKVGIFAQRAKARPNRIGVTIARIVAVEARAIVVAELDAIDGTPVVDLKPVMREFLPRGEVRQPAWASELMASYWSSASP